MWSCVKCTHANDNQDVNPANLHVGNCSSVKCKEGAGKMCLSAEAGNDMRMFQSSSVVFIF